MSAPGGHQRKLTKLFYAHGVCVFAPRMSCVASGASRWRLDPFDPGTSDKVLSLVALGFATKRLVPKKMVAALEQSQTLNVEAAYYWYTVQETRKVQDSLRGNSLNNNSRLIVCCALV